MNKDAVEDKTDKDGEPVDTEVVFKGEANVLEYLNSLLSSVPTVVLEPGETRFVRLSIDEGWKGLDAANALINNAISHQSQLSKKEVELLELENKNLKFREELANIDGQVLRDENENLKEQIVKLTEKLDTIKVALGELAATTVKRRKDCFGPACLYKAAWAPGRSVWKGRLQTCSRLIRHCRPYDIELPPGVSVSS